MKAHEGKRYEMLVRVRDFGIAHRDLFPRSEKGGEAFAQVAAAVDALDGQAIAQFNGHGSVQEATTNREVARDALRESLSDIARTARALAIDRPGIVRKFRVPTGVSDRVLLTRAQAFADEAAAFKADFVAHAMATNFLTVLRTRIADFERAISDQQHGKDARVSAMVGISDALASGMEGVRRLDAIVRNRLRDDAQVQAVWAGARRVGDVAHAPKRPSPSATAPAPAPALLAPPVAVLERTGPSKEAT